MPAFKRTLLCCAVAASWASTTTALANSSFDSFIDDATMDGRLRTVYYDVDNKEKEKNKTSGAWTGALWLHLKSGYMADFLAIGGTFYGVTKLYMDENNSNAYQLLIDEKKANGKMDGQGYGKLGQAWVDLKLPNSIEHISGHIQAGRQLLYTGLISSSGSRSAQSTWRGYKLEGQLYDFDLGLAFVDQMSLRNQAGFHDLTNFSGKQIDRIIGGELAYTFHLADDRKLKLKYRNAFAKDYLYGHNGEVKFETPIAGDRVLTLGGKYYKTKKDGDLWEGYAWYNPAFDDEATAGNLFAALDVDSWHFEAGVSHVKAETSQEKEGKNPNGTPNGYVRPGKYYYDFGKNTHGIWDLNTGGFAEDMIYDGETVWMIGASYDFSTLGVQGLELGYSLHYGSGMEVKDKTTGAKKSTSEYENDFHLVYKFPQPQLKGMKFKLKYGIYRNDEDLRKAINKQENDLRVWLDYNFTLF
ncbi:OprD family outer membrane porin [Endozoicomonas acroporae]|uniref:OprD family outer membrane porin n=1 Tax=Endozoicomonas acroporae TaxID=1701104 RepID=UPI003D78EF50